NPSDLAVCTYRSSREEHWLGQSFLSIFSISHVIFDVDAIYRIIPKCHHDWPSQYVHAVTKPDLELTRLKEPPQRLEDSCGNLQTELLCFTGHFTCDRILTSCFPLPIVFFCSVFFFAHFASLIPIHEILSVCNWK
ncbi:unnamed protein product, partial [Brassica rapa subsp. trilocularis]